LAIRAKTKYQTLNKNVQIQNKVTPYLLIPNVNGKRYKHLNLHISSHIINKNLEEAMTGITRRRESGGKKLC